MRGTKSGPDQEDDLKDVIWTNFWCRWTGSFFADEVLLRRILVVAKGVVTPVWGGDYCLYTIPDWS
jgi:hypothetical protein